MAVKLLVIPAAEDGLAGWLMPAGGLKQAEEHEGFLLIQAEQMFLLMNSLQLIKAIWAET
ncbi:MAG: hypothetical protein KXJ48_06270 [Vulcanococcus sp.]|nr:hypothetical protein [Vulcanococcus sp.]